MSSSTPAHDEASQHVSHRAPPALGEHTVDVLREAGFDAAAFAALLAAKAVHQAEYDVQAKASEQAAEVAQ